MTKLDAQPLKIGFDLDGVLLYNPARVVRPFISLLKKKKIFKREELEFYVPEPGIQELFWELLHKSSLCLAPGFNIIKQLKQQGLIEPYLITGRFNHLKKDFEKWQHRMNAEKLFVNCYMNSQDEQPHQFKEKLINQLDLDIFIEDNWDIVRYLNHDHVKADVLWITNLVDRRFDYQHKYLTLKQALTAIKQDYL